MQNIVVLPAGKLYRDGLDLIDSAIAFYIKEICASKNIKIAEKREKGRNGELMTWVGFTHLMDEMPYLKINTKSGITARILKLKKLGFIHTEMGENRHLLIAPTAKLTDLFISS